MSIEVKFRRGTTAEHSSFTGANGEITIDTTIKTLRVHDGSTSGGIRIAKYDELAEAGNINNGMQIVLSNPTDTDLVTNGAYPSFTANTKVTDAIDILNEVVDNVRNNTFVKSVSFVADSTSGGAGTSITLTTTVDGNANQFEINWGDGSANSVTSDTTPSHTYANNSGSPYTVDVIARNTGGGGEGSSASSTRANYITIFTATPVPAFELFRNSAGGSALSGSNVYVVENETLYLDNNTTNIGSATVQYGIDWGDGTSAQVVNSDSAAGGTAGARLSHTWGNGTTSGTGRDTVTLTLNAHSTALPADIPASATLSLKVYDDNPAAPNGLGTKTISFSSSGTSPKLASGFLDNTGGSTYGAGNSVNRTTATSGTIDSSVISTFAFTANTGTLQAVVNGTTDGSTTLDNTDNTGNIGSLSITEESDYNLLDASGSTISFASSIYYPGLYTGFKAKAAIAASGVSVGVNNMKLSHSATGNTNILEFVKDNLTVSPTVSVAGATLTENVGGTKRFISGIPYYNSGSPSLTLSGVTIEDLVGQTYTDQSNIVEVDDGTNQEGTSSDAITNTDYTYANIDGSTTMLAGSIPKANTGVGSAYSIGSLTVPVTSSSVRTVSRLKVRARNVNGTGSYSSDVPTIVQVHKASQSGISELAIAVSDSLGATYDDDGVRIFNFNSDTTNNPSYTSSTNFYTNSPYTEASDPGVQGTKEASVRIGQIKHDVTNYSSGYLPVGPDRSGDTGTQYFTFAFRRTGVANFDINITSSGITGLWIAAPGTAIDSTSNINGWLDASTTYNGSGVPGENTGSGGNGSNGCAFTTGDRIAAGTSLSGGYTMTLGSENMSNATGNVVLVRIALASGQSISALSVGVAS